MASVKVHAGDWEKGSGSFLLGSFSLPKRGAWSGSEGIHASKLESVDIATEETVKRIGGTVGWGVVGGALLGPVGLLAGLLLGGKGKEVTFVAKFKDGRRLLATTDAKTYAKILASVF